MVVIWWAIFLANIIPKFENGGYEEGSVDDNGVSSPSFIYPKEIQIGFDFTVLHDYDLGWKASTGFLAELFPELGSGEDIARIIGGRSFGGAQGAAIGSILGGLQEMTLLMICLLMKTKFQMMV